MRHLTLKTHASNLSGFVQMTPLNNSQLQSVTSYMVHMLCTCSSSQWVSIFRGGESIPVSCCSGVALSFAFGARCFYIENRLTTNDISDFNAHYTHSPTSQCVCLSLLRAHLILNISLQSRKCSLLVESLVSLVISFTVSPTTSGLMMIVGFCQAPILHFSQAKGS